MAGLEDDEEWVPELKMPFVVRSGSCGSVFQTSKGVPEPAAPRYVEEKENWGCNAQAPKRRKTSENNLSLLIAAAKRFS